MQEMITNVLLGGVVLLLGYCLSLVIKNRRKVDAIDVLLIGYPGQEDAGLLNEIKNLRTSRHDHANKIQGLMDLDRRVERLERIVNTKEIP